MIRMLLILLVVAAVLLVLYGITVWAANSRVAFGGGTRRKQAFRKWYAKRHLDEYLDLWFDTEVKRVRGYSYDTFIEQDLDRVSTNFLESCFPKEKLETLRNDWDRDHSSKHFRNRDIRRMEDDNS